MYDSSRKNKQSYSRNIKKDIETVLKLNIQNYPSTENEKGTIASYVNKKNNTLYNNEESKSKNQTNDGFNTLSISIRKLKTFFPNIKDEVFNENYTNGHIPSRTEHIKIEEKYKLKINQLTQKESELKKAQEKLEKNIQKLDKIMDDQKLSKEVINSVDNNSSKLEKIFAEKYINDINKILKNDKEKERKVNYLNTKEYQEQLNLFLLREDFTSKQKIKEINISLEKNIKRKNEKIEELNKVNDSLKKLHDKKKKEIEELYMHYLNILKEGNDTRSEGLSWIIREIFSLDKKVIVSFFPKFLDKLCIKYLFNITHINMKITEIEKKIKLCKKDFKDKGIIKVFEKTNNNDIFTQRNIVTQETLKKIKRQFTLNNNNMGKKNKSNEKNLFLKKMQKINQKNEKNEKIQKNYNSQTNHENKIFSSILQIHPVGQDEDEDKKHENDNNLPYINGDPNNFMNGKDMTLSYTNKFLKNELRTSTRIPPIIRLKDFDKMAFFKNHFTQGDIIKVNTFFALKLKLSKLREEKDILKTNEMDRIFKEFQRNNYEQRFNVDKIKVISALIGEDNINNELFRQERRERLYFEQISKSQLYNKKINYRAFNEKALNDNIEKLKTA
jgi:hypothetical protein